MPENKENHEYDDIINLPRPISKKHPPMPPQKRAAIFSPFAALTGFEDAIFETSRVTDRKIDLNDETKDIIGEKLRIILEQNPDNLNSTITYFVADKTKSGGSYNKITGVIKRLDEFERKIIFTDKSSIPLDDVFDVDCEVLKNFNIT